MSDVPADVDDAGIFALVVLTTIAVAAGLVYVELTLWLLVPAFLVLSLLGELAARQIASIKARQKVSASD